MASFTQNITNSVRVFGEGPSTKWGQAGTFPATMVWGTSTWGEGRAVVFEIVKYVTNTPTFSWVYASSDFNKVFAIGSVSPSFEASVERLSQGGWYYVFVSDTTNAEERDFASWTSGTRPDVTFTCAAAASTSWSEL